MVVVQDFWDSEVFWNSLGENATHFVNGSFTIWTTVTIRFASPCDSQYMTRARWGWRFDRTTLEKYAELYLELRWTCPSDFRTLVYKICIQVLLRSSQVRKFQGFKFRSVLSVFNRWHESFWIIDLLRLCASDAINHFWLDVLAGFTVWLDTTRSSQFVWSFGSGTESSEAILLVVLLIGLSWSFFSIVEAQSDATKWLNRKLRNFGSFCEYLKYSR